MNNVIGNVLAIFGIGLKGKVNALEKRQDEFGKSVRYSDTCEAIHKGSDERMKTIEGLAKETRTDVKTILEKL